MSKPSLGKKILETIEFFLNTPYSGLEEYDAFRDFLNTLPEEKEDAAYFTIVNTIDIEKIILASNFSSFEYIDHVYNEDVDVWNDYVKKRFHNISKEMIEYAEFIAELADCNKDELLVLFNEIAYMYYEAASRTNQGQKL